MKKNYFLLLSAASFLFTNPLQAQSWVIGGNAVGANSSFGTNTNFSVVFKTNNTDRGRITNGGNWAIGSLGTASKLTVNSLAGVTPFRAQINGSSKLIVSGNGSVSVGSGTAGPANGLYVAGRTGIGIAAPASPLDVLNPSFGTAVNVLNSIVVSSDGVGLHARSVNNPGFGYGIQAEGGWRGIISQAEAGNYSGDGIGVAGHAGGSVGSRYGFYGTATGTGSADYGVYASAAGAAFNAAGYFNGQVHAVSYHSTSDKKFKQEITPLTNITEQVMKLKPTAYTFKTAEYKSMHLPVGRQIGIIADELEAVFPELVTSAVHPAEYDLNRNKISDEIKYKSVNYQGLIPILIASVQELTTTVKDQQTRMEEYETEIKELKQTISRLDNAPENTKSWMKQNTPNPVSVSTRIQYSIPEEVRAARILITNVKGQQLKVYNVNGDGAINFNVGTLPSGTYNYSLVTDGKTVSTKKLVIAR